MSRTPESCHLKEYWETEFTQEVTHAYTNLLCCMSGLFAYTRKQLKCIHVLGSNIRFWYTHVGQEVPVLVYTLLMCKPVFGLLILYRLLRVQLLGHQLRHFSVKYNAF